MTAAESSYTLRMDGNAACFECAGTRLRIAFVAPSIVRVTSTDSRPFSNAQSRIVVKELAYVSFVLDEDEQLFTMKTSALRIQLVKATGALSYYDADGSLLTREPEAGGRMLTIKDVYRNVFAKEASVAYGQSIDGARAEAKAYESVFDRTAFEAKLEFVFSDEEALFGFGSHEEGYGNLRGRSRDLYQQNMKTVVPAFVSTRGYGILFECSSLMTFHDDSLSSYWWADCVDELDFYLIQGDRFDDITRGFHRLTGPAPMLPKWAFGYVQSKERYVNATEMLEVVQEHRRRRIPLDCIVLDWKSWPNGAGWGQKSFDPTRFSDAGRFISALHALGARLMVSIWPIMTGGCENQRELLERGLMLGNQSTYDAFQPEARESYWEQARRGLFDHGVDAWWCDCTEPFEADWSGAVKPEPQRRLAINTGESKLYLDPGEINAYSLAHSQGIYDGQRKATSSKRVLNLTRSSYAGQHRYGTVTWNGDVSATWETLSRCIPEGLNFCATGEPYWTVDAGGFFIDHKPDLWFWRGDYPSGCRGLTAMDALEPDPSDLGSRDLGYWELYTRWLQYAAYLPMFRSHGTDAAREAWRFGDVGEPFYEAIVRTIRWRYRMVPYLYSLAAEVTRDARTMIRAVALEFPHDCRTHGLTDQFLLGVSLLVCPVTHPMLYTANSQPVLESKQTRPAYLPQGCNWFDLWTNDVHRGGQWIGAKAPLGVIPVFVRAGSIVPLGAVMQHVDEVPDAPYEIRVYTGADVNFTLYEDAGDGYAYEDGACARVELCWLERNGELKISSRSGGFKGLVESREFNVVFFSDAGSEVHTILYSGEEIIVRKEGQ